MIINHNIAALNTYRQLSNNQTIGQKSLEKLSSGLRINRAGDDAAGLAISEKMRAQIRGLDQASRNAQDGISMIQTAEGALNEVHSILQRMRELANQAANDTNVNVDRDEIQKEINQLTSEINRIGNTTEFNTQKLLNGGGVDPTSISSVSANGLVVPASLSDGVGATEQLASTSFTLKAPVAADNGQSFEITIGDRKLTVTYDSSIASSASSTSGDTITIGISDGNANNTASALRTQLTNIITADENLNGNYTVSVTNDNVTITAVALSQNTDGKLQGVGTQGVVSTQFNGQIMEPGAGAVAASGSYTNGTTITLTAAAGGTALNGVQIIFATDNDAAITSTWNPDNRTLTVAADWDGAGAPDLPAVLTSINNALQAAGFGTNALTANWGGTTVGSLNNFGTITLDGGTDGNLNTGAIGVNATTTIDFSNTSAAELAGTGISITNAAGNTFTVDFYDSANGKYQGNADFAIDLNGARTTEKIVERIVGALAGTAGTAVNNEQYVTAGAGVYGANGNAIAGVFITATEDGKGIQIMAETAGASGNDIKVFNNADVTVTEVYENARVDNEGVVSARALADGEHTVTITNVAAEVQNLVVTTAGSGAATVTVAEGAEDGLYQLDTTDIGNAQLQKWNTSTEQWDNVGDAFNAAAVATHEIGDVTIDITDADWANGDTLTFQVVGTHYTATLTEAGADSAGATVIVNNGQQNVTLTAANGVGQAVVNIGAWDVDAFEIGDSISWSFATEMATTEETISSGQFTASFQIGANTAQSMTIEINDMRSEALRVSGTTAGAEVKAKNGAVAKYTQIESVSNGTTNNNIEFALDVSDHEKATAAISVINDAIEMVSAERSKLGAYQNRLEHTINNLGTSSENLTAAESRIRDVDMAKEMMEFTKMNILSQAAQAMLAQANQQPQGVLQLLR